MIIMQTVILHANLDKIYSWASHKFTVSAMKIPNFAKPSSTEYLHKIKVMHQDLVQKAFSSLLSKFIFLHQKIIFTYNSLLTYPATS